MSQSSNRSARERPTSAAVIGEQVDGWTKASAVRLGTVWLRVLADNQVGAWNAECPHLGCKVGFDSAKSCFLGFDGTVQKCPSPRAMDSLETRVPRRPRGSAFCSLPRTDRGARPERSARRDRYRGSCWTRSWRRSHAIRSVELAARGIAARRAARHAGQSWPRLTLKRTSDLGGQRPTRHPSRLAPPARSDRAH